MHDIVDVPKTEEAKPKKKMYMKEKYTGKDSNVEFKSLSVGGKVGSMKSGPATHNRLY